MITRLLALASLAALLGSASAQEKAEKKTEEKVDNPDYASWSKFPTGTSVTRTWRSTDPTGQVSLVTETLTLKEIKDDKIVLDEEFLSEVPGATAFKTKPKSREIPKQVTLPDGVKKGDVAAKLAGAVEEGKEAETVTVGSGQYKDCKMFKTATEKGKNRTEGKSWLSDEVPGRLVRSEETTSSNGKSLFTTIREVIEVKKPK